MAINRNAFGLVVIAAVGGIWWVSADKPGLAALGGASFSDEDIGRVKASIREKFAAKPEIIVDDVVMLKKSARELTGYAKVKIGALELTKACTANMEESGKNYIWQCQ